jgi:hypothetical protein
MKTLRIGATVMIGATVLFTACAHAPQRLDLIALEGQPLARALDDQRECASEYPFTNEESTLQAYAACLLARGYISEVPLSVTRSTRRITVYVRPDRADRTPAQTRSASQIRGNILACQGVMQQAYQNVSVGYALARELVRSRTFGGNMQRRELIDAFASCMSNEGYAVSADRDNIVIGRPASLTAPAATSSQELSPDHDPGPARPIQYWGETECRRLYTAGIIDRYRDHCPR